MKKRKRKKKRKGRNENDRENEREMTNNNNIESIEEELNEILGGTRDIMKFLPDAAGERRRVLVNEVERSIDEARACLKRLSAAAGRTDSSAAREAQSRVRGYEADIKIIEKELLVGITTPGATLSDILDREENEQRGRGREGLQRLGQTSDGLRRTERTGLETEAIGVGIITDLQGQREQLEAADRNLFKVDDNMAVAKKKLRELYFRIIADKVILIVIIIIQIIVLFLIIFFKWIY